MHTTKIYFVIIFIIFMMIQGCESLDKAKSKYDEIKHQYEEFIGESKRGPKPFKVIFQKNENDKLALITANCQYIEPIKLTYYATPADAHARYFQDTKTYISYPGSGKALKPYWDIRYVNQVDTYINGGVHLEYANHGLRTGLDARQGNRNIEAGTYAAQTDVGGGVVQSKCIEGRLAAGTTISLWDAPEQYLTYAGPQSTFIYKFGTTDRTTPWHKNGTGNLVLQANFEAPIYNNFSENIGGGVYFGMFMRNNRTHQFLNYVIGIYAVGEAWIKEKAGIRFDPTTNVIHVATTIRDNSWWSTKSPKSKKIQEIYNTPNKQNTINHQWNDFYRVNISYQNLLAVLRELKKNPPPEVAGIDFGLSPEDWEVSSIMIQYELEETGGKAIFSGSFKDFEAFISPLPI